MKITDDLMVQALQGFEMEYDCPVFCSICIIDSFLSTGRNWYPAFVAISKYRTLLVVPLTISVYIDGSVDLIEYPLLRFEYCKVTKAIFGNYYIKAKFTDDKKSEIIKLNISRNVIGANLTMQKTNTDKFVEMFRQWGNSGFFS